MTAKDNQRQMIEAAKGERQRLMDEIAERQTRLDKIEDMLATYGVKSLRTRKPLSKHSGVVKDSLFVTSNEPGRFTGMKQAEAAYRVLIEKGGPAHINEIAEKLLADGLRLRDDEALGLDQKLARLRNSLVAALLRDERFKNQGKNVFVLAEPVTTNRTAGSL